MNFAPTTEVRVWDPYIRISHWLLAAAVLVNWYTDEPRWMHVWLGYLAAALVVLRVLWGFFGPANARFTSFVTGPRETLNYLFLLLQFSSKRYLGHSPAGAAMIVALLVMVGITSVTGWSTWPRMKGLGRWQRSWLK